MLPREISISVQFCESPKFKRWHGFALISIYLPLWLSYKGIGKQATEFQYIDVLSCPQEPYHQFQLNACGVADAYLNT